MNWQIITGAVAVYGALLSTWNAVAKHLENKAWIKVKMSGGFETFGPEIGPASILVTAINKGQQAVTLVEAGLRLPNKQHTTHYSPSGTAHFPHELKRGQNCYILAPIREVAEALKRADFSGTTLDQRFLAETPERMIGDRAYDSDPLDQRIHEHYGVQLIAPHKFVRVAVCHARRPAFCAATGVAGKWSACSPGFITFVAPSFAGNTTQKISSEWFNSLAPSSS